MQVSPISIGIEIKGDKLAQIIKFIREKFMINPGFLITSFILILE